MKRLLFWASTLLLLLVASCQPEEPIIQLESIQLNKSVLTLGVNKQYQLIAQLSPMEATYKDLVWSSSNPFVASVDADGLITTVKEGTTTIRAEHNAKNSKDVHLSATCVLTVKASTPDNSGESTDPDNPNNPSEITLETSLVEGLAFMNSEYEVLQYDTIAIKQDLRIFPANIASKVTVKFQSSDPSVATVNAKGQVIGVREGEVLILASANGKEAKCKVYVYPFVAPQSLSLNYTEKEILPEKTLQLRASFTPNYPTYSKLEWSSSNTEVASVNENGLVTIHKNGDAVITVTHKAVNTYDKEVSATCAIKVRPVLIESLSLNYTEYQLFEDQTLQLRASLSPTQHTYSELEWSSSNTEIATVNESGLVSALKGGEVIITATHKAVNTYDKEVSATCSIKVATYNDLFEMIYVEGGTFQMGATAEQGDDANSDEKPVHTVSLSSFYLSKTEVTQAQYQAVMGYNPSYNKGDNLPVESLSWSLMQAFCEKLSQLTGKNYVLPTEAQWEYAARGGKYHEGTKYAGSNNADEVAWTEENSNQQSHPVATKAPNALGLYDMSGNVYEWCADRYGKYSAVAQTNPTGPETGGRRVIRGGSWRNSAGFTRVSHRGGGDHGSSRYDYGFRIAMIP